MLLLRKSSVRTSVSKGNSCKYSSFKIILEIHYFVLPFPPSKTLPRILSCSPKYNLLCLYGVTYLYVQKADHQILEKWLVYLSLEETTSPTLSLPGYLQFFLQGWDLLGFPTCICILARLLLLSSFNSCLGNNVVNTSQVQHI